MRNDIINEIVCKVQSPTCVLGMMTAQWKLEEASHIKEGSRQCGFHRRRFLRRCEMSKETTNVESMPKNRAVTNEHHLEGKTKVRTGRSMDPLAQGEGLPLSSECR